MAGHFPFQSTRGQRYGHARLAFTAFFEAHDFDLKLQEKYYKWWYDWAKQYVQNDPDLSVTKGVGFQHYPYGQHSLHSFHLNEKQWATIMSDLGDLLRDTILPRMSDEERKKLEADHDKMLKALDKEAETNPREPAPDVGYFRHT